MKIITYKTGDGFSLKMKLYFPEYFAQGAQFPLIVFFFGGGWVGGDYDQFRPQAEYFAQKGFVTACPEYRIRSKHDTTPFKAYADAVNAVACLTENKEYLKIDPSKTILAGGSAGGHLAALTVILNPAAAAFFRGMVLFNPVLDTSPQGYGYEILKENYKRLSPIENLNRIPPTLILHGKADRVVPYSNPERFVQKALANGCDCTLIPYENCDHGFFNQEPYYSRTLQEVENWIQGKILTKSQEASI